MSKASSRPSRPCLKPSSSPGPINLPARTLTPSVHFPPTPGLTTDTYFAHSSSMYDRSPLVVTPNACALPERGCPSRRSGGGVGLGSYEEEMEAERLRNLRKNRPKKVAGLRKGFGAYRDQGEDDVDDEEESRDWDNLYHSIMEPPAPITYYSSSNRRALPPTNMKLPPPSRNIVPDLISSTSPSESSDCSSSSFSDGGLISPPADYHQQQYYRPPPAHAQHFLPHAPTSPPKRRPVTPSYQRPASPLSRTSANRSPSPTSKSKSWSPLNSPALSRLTNNTCSFPWTATTSPPSRAYVEGYEEGCLGGF